MTYQITIQPSGRQFRADADQAILTAGIDAGVNLPYGCRDGACGACKCLKLEGDIEVQPHQEKALSAEERAGGYILTCRAIARSNVVLESKQVTAEDALPVKKLPARVTGMEKAADDVMLLTLQLPATAPFAYHAGQYVEVVLRDGDRRAYSMASAPHLSYTPAQNGQPASCHIQLHIRHLPGGKFTDQVFSSMKPRTILRLEGPFGSFYLREDSDSPMIFLASGTGFAPIKALIESLEEKNIHRPVTMYWGARQRADLYLHDWMLEAAQRIPHLRYIPVLSEAQEGSWNGRTGLVHLAVAQDFPDLSAHQVYACGSPVVVEAAAQHCITHCGLPEAAFFADSFVSEADRVQA